MAKKRLKQWETKYDEAVLMAEKAADESMLPQTVFMDGDSGGWWHTHSLANRLMRAECKMTVLPKGYFH